MAEYIKREDAIDKIIECVGEDEADFLEGVLHLVPSVDVVERKRGKWNWVGFNIECSECGAMPNFDSTEPLYNFCPNCGAKMESEEEE